MPNRPVAPAAAPRLLGPPVAGGGDLPFPRAQRQRFHPGAGVCGAAAGVDRTAERALAPIGATPAEGPRDAASAGRSAAACSEAIRRQAKAAHLSLRQLQRRCCSLRSAPQTTASRPFPHSDLEALADARLDIHGPDDRNPWLVGNGAPHAMQIGLRIECRSGKQT